MNLIEKYKNFFYYSGFFSITAYPFLNFLSSPINIVEASYSQLNLFFVLFLTISLIVSEIIRRFFKIEPLRILIFYMFFLFFFFYSRDYGDFFVFVVEKMTGMTLRARYLFVIFLILGSLMLSRFSRIKAFQHGGLAFIFVITFFSLGEILFLNLSHKTYFSKKSYSNPNKRATSFSFEFKSKPNIYFLLLDAYPRHDTLLSERDNTSFLDFFKKREFIVANNAYSNYQYTWPSLSATFQMSYLKDDDIINRDVLSSTKEAFIILKKNNYKIAIVPSPYKAFDGRNVVDFTVCKNFLANMFISDTTLTFFKKSFLSYFFHHSYFTLREIEKLCELPKDNPLFSFIHFAHLHDYVFDNSCSKSCIIGRGDGYNKPRDIKLNTQCMERLVEETVDLLISNDPNAIIIVQSDHGPWYFQSAWREKPGYIPTVRDFKRGYGIFSAFRLPNQNIPPEIIKYLQNSPSPINNFRILFSLLSEQKTELLPDKVYVDTVWDLTYLRD